MKIIFSRKGFDSGSGGASSPIIDGRPVSLPIPANGRSNTTYGDLGLGGIVECVTRGRRKRYTRNSLCHHDPMFENGRCAFGQVAAAQSHLANKGVGVGDVFLFFGRFANLNGKDDHHRLFGYLIVEEITKLGVYPDAAHQPAGFSQRHPHTIGEWNSNNTLYVGEGVVARAAPESLRLSRPGGPMRHWRVPPWLREAGLTYHGDAKRWEGEDSLEIVSRGQEFICDISERLDARKWLDEILSAIREGTHPKGEINE